jgi:hypothetical protein
MYVISGDESMMKKIELLGLAALLVTTAPAFAQGSNMFSGQGGAPITPPGAIGNIENDEIGSPTKDSAKSKPSPGMAGAGGQAGGDYTADEKRMQKKFKGNVQHAKDLIEKGESMMKSAKGNTSHKDYKKGKIVKEIGEKTLTELQANNPFPEPEKPVKAGAKGKDDATKKEL